MPSILGREAVLNQQTHASLGDSAPANSWLIANGLGRLGCYHQITAGVSWRCLSAPPSMHPMDLGEEGAGNGA